MAVCDIDEIAQGLKDEIQLEDSLFKVTMYVSTHQELIDSLSMDTLDMAFEYLYDNPTVVRGWMADTKETAFNSSLDARMNTLKQALGAIEPGEWTSKLFALENRQFYKPKGE